MFDLNIYAAGLATVMAFAVVGWLISIPKGDVSIVDSLWSLFFLVLTIVYITSAPTLAARSYLLLFLVTVWASRLSVYITLRNRRQPEDRRYQAIRAENEPGFWFKSLYVVFTAQAVLAWMISLPLLGGILSPARLGWLDHAAVLLWLIGFGFEAIGDQQLTAFKANPNNQDQVLEQGLWRYTRHPNYFGEACVWWGFYLFALAAGAWWSIIGPILVTLLLMRISGVALLEKDISDRRPAYPDYIRRTNAFLPGPPRAVADSD
jgi:steroid 5-alpha reductase family enzyme